jgi:GTPase SAR1 family protein
MGSWVSESEGFMLVYSIDDMESLDSIKKIIEKIVKIKSKKITEIPCILVGAKSDTTSRKVSTQMASNLAQSHNMLFMGNFNKIINL